MVKKAQLIERSIEAFWEFGSKKARKRLGYAGWD
jgi:hypothetical protein